MSLRLPEKKRLLAVRGKVLQSIRRFFDDRGYLEVETPVRLPTPALELHLDAEPAGEQFLRTSPELHMKRMLAAGYEKLYQLGPCFRRGERGRLHSPEFTMLEWYRREAGYLDILIDTKTLIGQVARDVAGSATIRYQGQRIDLLPDWERLTVEDAFILKAGWNPVKEFDAEDFDLDLVEKVEPSFPADRPTLLMDYPAEAAALARCKPARPDVAERWELYIGGMEIANAFGELTDAAEQRRRFGAWAAERRRLGKEVYPLDEEFLAALDQGLPPCSGVALGVDRLVMLFADAASIDDVRAFPS